LTGSALGAATGSARSTLTGSDPAGSSRRGTSTSRTSSYSRSTISIISRSSTTTRTSTTTSSATITATSQLSNINNINKPIFNFNPTFSANANPSNQNNPTNNINVNVEDVNSGRPNNKQPSHEFTFIEKETQEISAEKFAPELFKPEFHKVEVVQRPQFTANVEASANAAAAAQAGNVQPGVAPANSASAAAAAAAAAQPGNVQAGVAPGASAAGAGAAAAQAGNVQAGVAPGASAAGAGAAAAQAGNVQASVAPGAGASAAAAASANANVQLAAAPADFITAEGALPVIKDVFLFNDGSHFGLDRSDLVPGSERFQQAQEINKNIPASIQQALSRGEINFYEPGTGKYYYIRKCDGDNNCYIVQVDRRTNSYTTPEGNTRFIKLNIQASKFRFFHSKIIAKSFKINTNETLPNLSSKLGIPFPFLQSANPNGPSGGAVNIPASAHQVAGGETLEMIAQHLGVDAASIKSLNGGLSAPKEGQVIRVPPTAPGSPLSYTAQEGDSLPKLSESLGVDQKSLQDLNPGSKGGIKPGSVIALPQYLPTAGDASFTDSTTKPSHKRKMTPFYV
jgi:LysM repeat protein